MRKGKKTKILRHARHEPAAHCRNLTAVVERNVEYLKHSIASLAYLIGLKPGLW
jgi:hypothetical protein